MKFVLRVARNFACIMGFLITFVVGIFGLFVALDYISKLFPIQNQIAVFFVLLIILVSGIGAMFKTLGDTK